MRRLGLAAALAAALGVTACGDGGTTVEVTADPDAVLANGMTARAMVDARELNFKDLGGAFKSVNDQLETSNPNLMLVQLAAQDVKYAADDLLGWFPEGSGPETGLEMRAFPEVWGQWDDFTAHADDFRTEAARLVEIADEGDLGAVEAQARVVGQQCRACHDAYRAEDD